MISPVANSPSRLNPYDETFDKIFSILEQAGLFNRQNRQAIAVHQDPEVLADVFRDLCAADLLNKLLPERLSAIIDHPSLHALAQILVHLQKKNILVRLDMTSFTLIIKYVNNSKVLYLADALMYLHDKDLWSQLSDENKEAVMAHSNPWLPAKALGNLQRAGLWARLSQDNCNAIVSHPSPLLLASALISLYKEGSWSQEDKRAALGHKHFAALIGVYEDWYATSLWSQQYFNLSAEHENPRALAQAFLLLYEARILADLEPKYFDKIVKHERPCALALSFIALHRAGILYPLPAKRLNKIVSHPYPHVLAQVFTRLQKENILNQLDLKCFSLIIRHANNLHPWSLADVFIHLHREGLWSQLSGPDKIALISQSVRWPPAKALIDLHKAGLWSQLRSEEITAIIHHKCSLVLARAFMNLHRAGLWSQENREIVRGHPNPESFVKILVLLDGAPVLRESVELSLSRIRQVYQWVVGYAMGE